MYNAYIKKYEKRLKVDIDDYISIYRVDGFKPYCLICSNPLNIRAHNTPNRKAHFYHRDNSNCPTVDSFKQRYLNLSFKHYNHLQSEQVINNVKSNLSRIYTKCQKLCDNSLYYSEFKELLQLATKRRVWQYADIQLKHIPYCLLTLQLIFSSKTNRGRKSNVFFCFSNQKIDDKLWIDFRNDTLELLKYDANTKQLISVIPINNAFLKYDMKNKEKFNEKLSELLSVIH